MHAITPSHIERCGACSRTRSEVAQLVEFPTGLLVCGACLTDGVKALAGYTVRAELERALPSRPATQPAAALIGVLGTDAPVPVSPPVLTKT